MSPDEKKILEQAQTVIIALNASRKKARIYPATHSYVAEALQELLNALALIMEELPMVTVSIAQGEMYVEGRLMSKASIDLAELSQDLVERKMDSISFNREVTLDDLTEFVATSNLNPDQVAAGGGWDKIWQDLSLANVKIGERILSDGEFDTKVRSKHELYTSVLEAVMGCFAELRGVNKLDISRLEEAMKLLVAGVMDDPNVLRVLTTIKNTDEYTFYHSVNVAILSLLLGLKLKLTPSTLNRLGLAALLHDVGKMKIPDEIMNKPEELSKEEWHIMRSHAVEGVKVLSDQNKAGPLTIVVAAQHHARYDMTGYPSFEGIDKLHPLSELVAIADVYDALTSDRAYRKAMPPERALRLIIQGKGTAFHPKLTKVFAQMSGMFPVGTLVELDTDEKGVVCISNPDDLCRPKIKLLSRGEGPARIVGIVDLTQQMEPGNYRRSILRTLNPADYDLNVAELVRGETEKANPLI